MEREFGGHTLTMTEKDLCLLPPMPMREALVVSLIERWWSMNYIVVVFFFSGKGSGLVEERERGN